MSPWFLRASFLLSTVVSSSHTAQKHLDPVVGPGYQLTYLKKKGVFLVSGVDPLSKQGVNGATPGPTVENAALVTTG